MRDLAKRLIRTLFGLAGLKVERKGELVQRLKFEEGNLVVPKVWDKPYFRELLPFKLDSSGIADTS